MNEQESLFQTISDAAAFLKLDFSSEEMAQAAVNNHMSEETIENIAKIFTSLKEKKQRSIIDTMLRLSKLPVKAPKTFENFDFTRLRGAQVDELQNLKTLAPLIAKKNIAMIGPQGVGKTHLAMAFGRECCEKGYKTYFLKATELQQKIIDARKYGKESHLINSLIKPSCLIIDELGHCDFDRDSTRLFFDIVDRRYSRDTPNSMIITSNIDPSSWPQFFDEDSAVKCMMDRFFDHALMISFSGQSYRGRDNHRIKVVAGSQSGRPVNNNDIASEIAKE